MAIPQAVKSHRVVAWKLQVMRLKIHGSHLKCKVANKCLNVCKRVEVVDSNKT